jgi:hypothetical protein
MRLHSFHSVDVDSLFPASLRRNADVAGSGELLWPTQTAFEAVDWLQAQSLGILGLEVYGPQGQARGIFEYEWLVAPCRLPGEPWQEYVDRAARTAKREIEADAFRIRGRSATAERRFFIPFSTERDYYRPLSVRS